MDRKLNLPAGIEAEISSLRETFEIFDNPKDKFVQLMDMAKDQKPFKQEDRVESNKIYGCTSQAWVVVKNNGDTTFSFRTDSDALIVKGLLQILEKVFNNKTSDEILSVDSQYILHSIGLEGSVTSQRNNGFASAVEKIHKLIQ